MTFEYDLSGSGNPVVRPIPVYDAALLNFGELLMLGSTDVDTGDDEGAALVTAYDATQASQAVDAVGILVEDTYESGGTVPGGDYSPTTANTTNQLYYGQVTTNPFAVFKAEYLQGTTNDTAITSTSTTTLTIGSLADDKAAGSWFYFPLSASTAQYYLRFIVADASGSCTMDSALGANGTSADTVINILKINSLPHDIDPTAVGLNSDDFAGNEWGAANMRVIENIIQDDVARAPEYLGMSTARTRGADGSGISHRGLGPLNSTTQFYGLLIMLDHLFNQGD